MFLMKYESDFFIFHFFIQEKMEVLKVYVIMILNR